MKVNNSTNKLQY